MRGVRWFGRVLLCLTALFVLAAWYMVLLDHQHEVKRLRMAWGQNAEVPSFNPLNLVNPTTLSINAWGFYVFAFASGIPGLVCLILAWKPARKCPSKDA